MDGGGGGADEVGEGVAEGVIVPPATIGGGAGITVPW